MRFRSRKGKNGGRLRCVAVLRVGDDTGLKVVTGAVSLRHEAARTRSSNDAVAGSSTSLEAIPTGLDLSVDTVSGPASEGPGAISAVRSARVNDFETLRHRI